MELPVKDRKFVKVFVHRHEHPLIFVSGNKNFDISGIFWPRSGPKDIVPMIDQFFDRVA